ncbi:MAG: M15 family metallopeptidase [Ignavibacteriaceae bacterium]|nr:M15 family metallopeptidase [Ignavibacteriaceae bacterium]
MQLPIKYYPKLFVISSITLVLFLTTFIYAQQNQHLITYSPDNQRSASAQKIIIDADYTLDETLRDSNIPSSVKNTLELVTVNYYGFDGKLHQGQIIVNKEIVNDIVEIFKVIEEIKFPVEKVVPIVEYNWSDEKSMNDNNTSSFNYRFISGSRILSMHANGLAIDINPKQNPYVKNGKSIPSGSEYKLNNIGTIKPDSKIVKVFKEKGWTWGGDWKSLKDYQHFQKMIK